MKKFVSILLLVMLLASGVHMGITAYSAQKEAQETQATQAAQDTTSVVEPEIVEDPPEFSEDETTTTAAPEPTTQRQAPVGKTATKATAPTEEFVEVSQIAVFSQQEPFVEEPAEDAAREETKEETEEETTIGYEPVYDDPLPPEGEDWIE